MEIITLKVGLYECNCYILKIDNNMLIIDPGDDFELIDSYIKNNNLLGVLITHNHFDHIGALKDIKSNYDVKIYDKSNLKEGYYKIGPFCFDVIFNQGHSSDSISFYFKDKDIMFVGDFIFKENIGRCDLPTGNYQEMLKSINKIKLYNKDIILYPGHGGSTTLNYERKNNIYFNE